MTSNPAATASRPLVVTFRIDTLMIISTLVSRRHHAGRSLIISRYAHIRNIVYIEVIVCERPQNLQTFGRMDMKIMLMAVDQATDLLKAMANRSRLLLLCHMNDGEKSVGELARLIDSRDTAVSQQLTLLRKDGLVRARRDGQSIYYSLASPEAEKVIETLHGLYCSAAPASSDQGQ